MTFLHIPGDSQARERLAASLRQVVAEAEQWLKSAKDDGAEQWGVARERFEAGIKRAKQELAEVQDEAIYRAKQAARATDDAVHEHPYASIGVAAGVALLVGLLMARR